MKRGDRVGIWSPNCIEWVLTQYATARAGMILVIFSLNLISIHVYVAFIFMLSFCILGSVICVAYFNLSTLFSLQVNINPAYQVRELKHALQKVC